MYTTTLQRLQFQLANQSLTFSISSMKSRCVVKLQAAIFEPCLNSIIIMIIKMLIKIIRIITLIKIIDGRVHVHGKVKVRGNSQGMQYLLLI